ncbi:PadR family transcriptional regulator [Nocardioides sp.]|uniref:PadR family transcriptional regulator n=1 Tax=Nocardioides sp. TaxID=35761 RepID=UPI00273296BE|nr:PadR family transcriptional regulator [Nocardioides sp.]MDP3893404.1 PadR family transcriptional regulator [Nocardioides sp.]
MGQELPVTSYAVLGLLTFGDELTGYELKQRADRTLRFYWVAPAMSQIYTELARLSDEGLVAPRGEGRRTTYAITDDGRRRLARWLEESPVGFPVLKHPVALRLLIGHLVKPAVTVAMLRSHLRALDEEILALREVRASLEGADAPGQPFRHPSLVADWGLAHFTQERATIEDLIRRLEEE